MIDESTYAIIGALFGGGALKAIERYFARNDKKLDDATLIRQELRSEVQTLRDEVATMRTQIEQWQSKYYDLQSENAQLQVRYQVVTEEMDKLRDKVISAAASSDGKGLSDKSNK